MRKMMRRPGLVLLMLGGWLGAAACLRQPAEAVPVPGVAFEAGEVRIESATGTLVLGVEIAETPRQHRAGLSRRTELSEHAGMLFLFPEEQPRGTGFWMYRTLLPLSVAFLDSARVIREVRDMRPCRSPIPIFCRRYRAGVPFHAALEVNRGFFRRYGIGPGDRVVLVRGD